MLREVEFLDYLYKNIDRGIISIDSVIESITDEDLEKLVVNQKKEYKNILEETEKSLNHYGRDGKEVGTVAKVNNDIMSKIKLLKDKSSSSVAKIMIEGINKGILEIQTYLNNYVGESDDVRALGEKFLNTEEENSEKLKAFL